MLDFTLLSYKNLLSTLLKANYRCFRYDQYINQSIQVERLFILRQDVDRKPQNALKIAQLQHDMGVYGTYYFRIVPESFQPKFIEAIAALGHEIGYHYEDLTLCRGDINKAIEHFERSLAQIRQYAPVSTICMHGSPLSRWDNRDLWKHHNYRDYGVVAEPYFDVDFAKVYYLTDTGRRWDGHKVSVRDKVKQHFDFSVHSTKQLIEAVSQGNAPKQIMQNIHPERWTDNSIEWLMEYSKSAVKNPAKRIISWLR